MSLFRTYCYDIKIPSLPKSPVPSQPYRSSSPITTWMMRRIQKVVGVGIQRP